VTEEDCLTRSTAQSRDLVKLRLESSGNGFEIRFH
jgi:hypothetical protein